MVGTVRGLKDIQRELLSWGRHVEVIAPPELRRSMAEEARAMAAVYGC
jgi:predicted DNA-binding transcriptional regulator YafY